MQHYNQGYDELYHYGVLGMKWGKRKYHNSDGTYNDVGKQRIVKDLKKDHKKSSSYSYPYQTSKQYQKVADDLISSSKSITKQDINELRSLKENWFSTSKKLKDAEIKLSNIAHKLAKETFDKELKKNGDSYPTDRDKEKLFEYILHDDDNSGYTQARKMNPDLKKSEKIEDQSYEAYRNKRSDIGKKVLGKYGDTILHKDKWSTYTISESLEDAVSRVLDADITFDKYK